MIINIKELRCLRCSHSWVPRKADVRCCPKCHSPLWDKPKEKKNADTRKSKGAV